MEENKPMVASATPEVKEKEKKKAGPVILVLIILAFLVYLAYDNGYLKVTAAYDGDKFNESVNARVTALLKNETFVVGIANNVNLGYWQQYNAIPIYRQSLNGVELYSCSNFTRIQ